MICEPCSSDFLFLFKDIDLPRRGNKLAEGIGSEFFIFYELVRGFATEPALEQFDFFFFFQALRPEMNPMVTCMAEADRGFRTVADMMRLQFLDESRAQLAFPWFSRRNETMHERTGNNMMQMSNHEKTKTGVHKNFSVV